VFGAISLTSFFSLWYWVLTVVVWTLVCRRTLGVPHDMILRARRLPEVAARVDLLARIEAERAAGLADAFGAPLAATAGFALAGLGALGFWSDVEAAQAAFLLLAPLAVVALGRLRLARQVRGTGLAGEPLRRRLARRRALDQVVGTLAMLAAALAALGRAPY
jgi:hypothetical protein